MKLNKLKGVSLGIIFFICLNNFMIYLPTQNYDTQSLKTSAGEITIVTPENKTYNDPMAGYFPATYGFENDADGSSLKGWDNPTAGISSLGVVSERFGHKKVIEAYDGGSGTGWIASHYFDNTEGTIEFWWAVSSVASLKSHQVVILDSTLVPLFGIQVESGQIQVLTGGIWFDISGLTTTANTWDHVRLDFRSGSGSTYQGLTQNQYRIYYNGIDKGAYNFQNIGDPDNMRLYSGLVPVDVYGYYDAIGFSWDSNYDIGDNLNEGLLLSYDNTTTLDWKGYSLDGEANVTILGNKTISMPNFGGHSVQIFGNSTFGAMYQSNKVFFTTTDYSINLLSPENMWYTQPMDGYYPATFDFQDETVGATNEDINFIDTDSSSGGSYFEMISEFENHSKVLKCVDDAGLSGFNGIHYFDNKASKGTIEYWVLLEDVVGHYLNGMKLTFFGDGGQTWYLSFYADYIRINGWISLGWYSVNKWYHIKMDYDFSVNEVSYFIDGEYKRTLNFGEGSSEIDYVRIDSDPTRDSSFEGYIDAIGYTGEKGYKIGDNKHEGLLLSYETNEDLDWIGYSLDNEANITIMGNKVLSMPRNGTHTIQVFGNNSLGDIFQSEKRYFTMHYNSVDVITPENITYTAPMDGYFPGTYGFENDVEGDTPEGWTTTTGTGCDIEVKDEINGHKKVVELSDYSASHSSIMTKYFTSLNTSVNIEFWVATTDASQGTVLSFQDSAGHVATQVEIGSNKIKFLYQGHLYLEYAMENDQWRHIRIDFDCVADKVTFWLDKTQKEDPLNFYTSVDYIEKVVIGTNMGHSTYSSYLDAFGYSWDPYYHVGDNHDEGILFSYDDSTEFSWNEISLDAQPNQVILGDKTLPVPEDGMHSIQFFAQDSIGDYYESELRFFTTEIAPSVEWTFPENGSTVIFPYSQGTNDGLFTFDYDDRLLDDIELVIDGDNLGSIWNNKSIVLNPYADYTDKGYLPVTLLGINNSVVVDSDTRYFKFVKVTDEYTELLDSNTQIIGQQLYMILHDPHGDNSYSSMSESTTLSIGVGSQIINALGVSVKVGAEFSLFGVTGGASVSLNYTETLSESYDFRYEITETTSLTSNQVTNDADYIGPGYGDSYWGESWIYKWVLNGTHRDYSNGTDRWEKPKLYYGILRGVETFVNDEHAPEEWKNQNAVYNDTLPVSWINTSAVSGGLPYDFEYEVSTTTKRTTSFQIEFGTSFEQKFGPVETMATIELNVKNYAETEVGNIHKVAYHIEDDDPSDSLVQRIGIDERFGTYIFGSEPFFCETSYPLEHNTYDYLPPEIDFPTISFDTNGDNTGPANDDSPLVQVNVLDEGSLQNVYINYSIDNGISWNFFSLSEIIASPGIWEGTIPAQAQDTLVKWYIFALDAQGNKAERKDIYGDPFEYTVIAKPFVPSYPPILIVISLMIPVVALLLRYRKKIYTIKS